MVKGVQLEELLQLVDTKEIYRVWLTTSLIQFHSNVTPLNQWIKMFFVLHFRRSAQCKFHWSDSLNWGLLGELSRPCALEWILPKVKILAFPQRSNLNRITGFVIGTSVPFWALNWSFKKHWFLIFSFMEDSLKDQIFLLQSIDYLLLTFVQSKMWPTERGP